MREISNVKFDEGFQMNTAHILKKKRDGGEFTKEEIEYFVSSLVNGSISESQIGAMLMAMYIRGLTYKEIVDLTRAMVFSGEQLQWDLQWQGVLADKHSTGGIGDKISIVLAPILAACGLKVPMISGRSLEHTGGTLDKLESIPGLMVDLDVCQMQKALEHAGCFITAATQSLCPADKTLYRVRDITCTVDNIHLIVSSIISKKVASGTKFLVVDVKVGRAAFCKTEEMGRALARDLIRVSAELGVTTKVVLSRMDEPLGRCAGNALEVIEAVQCLTGDMSPQISRIVLVLGVNLLVMTNICKNEAEAEKLIQKVIKEGSAMDRFCRMLSVQGVNEETITRLVAGEQVLPMANYTTDIPAVETGWVSGVDAMIIGQVCQWLGACRRTTSSQIDPSVGVQVHRRVGDQVRWGDVWLTVHHSSPSLSAQVYDSLTKAITISNTEVKGQDIIIEVIHQ
ncbi:thymidine phosphorylase-like [Macrosteles quadrilineatus]|uniref:thymidine phosphorylase-like n=1 Tax=Macrosteles quadrilineatus TaxID=74068 RepID=UPI0023E1780B|nr:thymidine phosphorylase-like [Macrosteles quadrilineatus]